MCMLGKRHLQRASKASKVTQDHWITGLIVCTRSQLRKQMDFVVHGVAYFALSHVGDCCLNVAVMIESADFLDREMAAALQVDELGYELVAVSKERS